LPGRYRPRWRRFGWRTGQLRPDVSKSLDARRERIAIVGDRSVQQPEEGRSFVISQLKVHGV
jgi:hypothetical protein